MDKTINKTGILFTLFVIVIFTAGCTNNGTDNGSGTVDPSTSGTGEGSGEQTGAGDSQVSGSKYNGFMALSAGQWAEYSMVEEFGETRQMISYLGEANIDGTPARGFEMYMKGVDVAGENVMQIWTEASDDSKVVKLMMKADDQVYCMDLETSVGEPPKATGTPDDFRPELQIDSGTYTTPGGKTVDAAIFRIDNTEIWASSQVPFGTVKVVDVETGKVLMFLQDYGTNAPERKISTAEMVNCIKMADLMAMGMGNQPSEELVAMAEDIELPEMEAAEGMME